MFDAGPIAGALLLLGVANGVPILAGKSLGRRFDVQLDGGTRLPDGQMVFGAAKTFRGIVLSIIGTAVTAELLGLGWAIGAGFAAASMAGDLLSSFVKRRLRVELHGQSLGLDQIPESLIPMLVFRDELHLSGVAIIMAVGLFIVLQLALSRLLFRLGIRDRPW